MFGEQLAERHSNIGEENIDPLSPRMFIWYISLGLGVLSSKGTRRLGDSEGAHERPAGAEEATSHTSPTLLWARNRPGQCDQTRRLKEQLKESGGEKGGWGRILMDTLII